MPRKKVSKASKVRELLAQGLSVKEIAQKTKAPPSMIYTLRKKAGATPREAKAQKIRETVDILTERATRYGFFIGQATLSQELKKTVYAGLNRSGNQLDYDQLEALDMIVHKIARIVNGDPNYVDSWDDIGGYAKLVSDRIQGVIR